MNTRCDVQKLHESMLEAQREGGGFDLSFRKLMQIWQLRSTSAVSYRLTRLLEHGLVIFKDRGRYKAYRAVERA